MPHFNSWLDKISKRGALSLSLSLGILGHNSGNEHPPMFCWNLLFTRSSQTQSRGNWANTARLTEWMNWGVAPGPGGILLLVLLHASLELGWSPPTPQHEASGPSSGTWCWRTSPCRCQHRSQLLSLLHISDTSRKVYQNPSHQDYWLLLSTDITLTPSLLQLTSTI